MQTDTERNQLSFPKDKIKFLLLEDVHPKGVQALKDAGYTDIESHSAALPPAELVHKLAQAHVVGIRSKTQLTDELLNQAPRLLAIGAFCIGTDQIDLNAATAQGVAAFNSPFSSTRSVAELVIGAAICLARGLADKSAAAHAGEWLKSAKHAHELRNQTLGIVGYGRIGSQLSVLAEALGLEVIYVDIAPRLGMGRATRMANLVELLRRSDIVSLHVPEDESTIKMIGASELALMRPGALLINYARGQVIDAEAVADAIKNSHLGGAAVDVFADEPRSKQERFASPLQGLPNVLLTPHIGGSTEEAQENIGLDVADKLINFLDRGVTLGSVTIPELNLPQQAGAHRLLHIHHNQPGVLSELNSRLSALGINIIGQYLNTNPKIGYVVLDVAQGNTQAALEEIRQVKHTIRARSLY